jgi:phosphoribosylglycinamide formyltransferase 2
MIGLAPYMQDATMTTLGTPLSPNATKVMLLGSGELGKEVLIALQRLGVETIAVDRYENAPGQQVAHHARTITMSDPAQLKALIEEVKPDLVVPEIRSHCHAHAGRAGGRRRHHLHSHGPRRASDHGPRRYSPAGRRNPGPAHQPLSFLRLLAELQAAIDGSDGQPAIGYPCVVKPVMSSSGKGQSKIDGPADVAKAWDYAMAGGRVAKGRVIVEGFIDFDYEITQLTVRAKGRMPDRNPFLRPVGHIQQAGDYVESWQPHPCIPAAPEIAPDCQGRHRRPGRPGPVWRGTVCEGRAGLVQRSLATPRMTQGW